MAERWLEGRVVENRRWTDSLFSLRVEAGPIAFEAGQFVRIALDVDGERIARPFSLVNPPGAAALEFYGTLVPAGTLTPSLARLAPGDSIFVSDLAAGSLVLSSLGDAESLWLIATGTGLAPFLSILQTDEPWRRFRRVVLVHGVRHAGDLTYSKLLGELETNKGLIRVPCVSRERAPHALEGRIPPALVDGRLEKAAGVALTPESSRVLLCGNPAMIQDLLAILTARGLKRHRRREPGHIVVEGFW